MSYIFNFMAVLIGYSVAITAAVIVTALPIVMILWAFQYAVELMM